MKKSIIFFALFLLYSCPLFSQGTNSAYYLIGYVQSIARSWDDKCILFSQGGHGIISQTDTNASTIYWTSQLDYPGQNFFIHSIIQTSDSNFVALTSQIGPNSYFSAIKITETGALLWVKKYFDTVTNSAWDLAPTQDGGFILVGGGCSGQNFAIRCDTRGNIIWQNQYRDTLVYSGSAINICDAGNDEYYISGTNSNYGIYADNIVFKIDGTGNLIWFRKIVMDGPDWNGGIIASNDGGVTISGTTNVLDSTVQSSYLAHFDSAGNNLWIKVYTDGSTVNHNYGLIQLDNDNYIGAGSVYYDDIRNVQMANIKTDVNGNFISAIAGSRFEDGRGHDNTFSVKNLSSSSFLVGGTSFSKLNSDGFGYCHSDIIYMPSITPTYTIESISPVTIHLNFISDTITYTYNISPGMGPYLTCANATDVQSIYTSDKNISVFPNPFENSLKILVEDNLKSNVIIYDLASKIILEQEFVNSVSLNMERLARGLYLYEVRNSSGWFRTGKVVKD